MRTALKSRKVTLVLFYAALALTNAAVTVCGQSPLDPAFKPWANAPVNIVFIQPDDRILVGGNFTEFAPSGSPAVAGFHHLVRLKPNGALDGGFHPQFSGRGPVTVRSIALHRKNLWVGGKFSSVGPSISSSVGSRQRTGLVQLDIGQGIPTSFDAHLLGPNVSVRAITVTHDNKILIGGTFSSILGQACFNIARLNANGSLDTTFSAKVRGPVETIVEQPSDHKILIGGLFGSVNGEERHGIARLTANGLPDGFDPQILSGSVRAIAIQPDSKILVGGKFSHIGLQERSNIARLDPVTGLPDSFNPKANAPVLSIAMQLSEGILVGGDFTEIGGRPRNHIARFKFDGDLDSHFDPNVSGESVNSIAVEPEGKKAVIGGSFEGVAGEERKNIARLILVPQPTPPPTPTPTPTPTPIGVILPTADLATSVPISDVITHPVIINFAITPTLDQNQNCTADCYIGFGGDFTFDSAVISFASQEVEPAGITATDWSVGAVVRNSGPGTTKTLTVFGNGATPLSGSGTLFNLKLIRVGNTPGANSPLVWATDPATSFSFYDLDLNAVPANQINGLLKITGP